MENTAAKRSARRLILRVDLPALLAFAFFAGLIFLYLIPGFKTVMMERKRELIHEMSATAYSLLTYYHSLETEGVLSPEDAREQALEAIGRIRYGPELKDYFWITDMHPTMLMHPYRGDLIYQDLSNYKDSKGKTIFVDFVNAVSASGESYVDYMWQWNDDSTRVVPKLSYVRLFKPWEWVVGTGIYVEDVRAEIRGIIIRALVISGIIGILIIILLTFITRQSHRLEEAREEAARELRESRELYRALAEASTEGVMIWSRQGVQANKSMLAWLGFTSESLQGLSLFDLFETTDVQKHDNADELYEELSTRQHVKGTLRTREGNPIMAHADLSRIDMMGMQAVLAVIRPARVGPASPGLLPRTELLQSIQTGFFRISYGRRNRFLLATEPTLGMLGYQNLEDLLPENIDLFFANALQLRSFRTVLASGQDFMGQEVLIKRKDGKHFWAMVNVMLVRPNDIEIYCEGTIEPLSAAAMPPLLMEPGLDHYHATYTLEAPVESIATAPLSCADALPLKEVIRLMKEADRNTVIVTHKGTEPLGTIDAASLLRQIGDEGAWDTPAYRWMKAPVAYIKMGAPLHEAFAIMHRDKLSCLLVRDDAREVVGMITPEVLNSAFSCTPAYLREQIEEARSVNTLRDYFIQARKITIAMVLAKADPHAISLQISSMADAICRRVLSLCEEKAGNPPCRYAFIQTGSAGRREQSLSTDQDNGIIFEDVAPETQDKVQAYFLGLGRDVNTMLDQIGYRLCTGDNMAGNPKWCQPLGQWKKYFSAWITSPEPEALLQTSIFFDFRFAYGEEELIDSLRAHVKSGLHTSDIYFHHMAHAWKPFQPVASQFEEGKAELKRLLMPLTGLIRMYSLRHGITADASIERTIELMHGNHIQRKLAREVIVTWKNLTSLRLSHQAKNVMSGKEPSNTIDYQLDQPETLYFLRHGIDTIQEFMLKASVDFHTLQG